MRREYLKRFLPYFILLSVVILLYGNTLLGGFVWDDNLFTANQVYWRFDLKKILFSLANGLEYQPVRDLSFLVDIAVFGGAPFSFHLTNLLLFALVAILVYRLAGALQLDSSSGRSEWFVPLFTALFFAVHPLKSEIVAWITQRNTLLGTLFFLFSCLLFLRYLEKKSKSSLVTALGLFLLALFSKATVVVLPLLLLFIMFVKNRQAWKKTGSWLPLAPFFVLSAVAGLLHIAIARQATVISADYYGSTAERVAVALQLPFFYLKKSLLPTDISAFYAVDFSRSLLSVPVLASLAVLVAMAYAAWFFRDKFPELPIGAGWFVITLLPVSNLLATSPVVADRYLFLPSFGLAFMAAALISRIRLPQQVLVVICLLVIAIFSPLTFKQNRIWHDDITLWSHTAETAPQVAGVWFNLGRALHRTPQLGMALDAYLRALRLDPLDLNSLDNAAALFPSGRGSIAARHELVRSLAEQFPSFPAGLALTGYTETAWQHPDAAEELFLYLLAVDSKSLELTLALGNLYRKLGAFDRATAIYAKVAGSGQGRGEAEFGLAAIAAAGGNQQEKARLLAVAQGKGGVPVELLKSIQ